MKKPFNAPIENIDKLFDVVDCYHYELNRLQQYIWENHKNMCVSRIELYYKRIDYIQLLIKLTNDLSSTY